MRHAQYFDEFLRDTVNLNQTRIDILQQRVATVEDLVRRSDWTPTIRSFEAQGSWAHKTIIKPPNGGDFDADLVIFINPVTGWRPRDYVDTLVGIFRASGTYKDLVTASGRCATLDYTGDFHLDLVPCVVGRGGNSQFEVCNRRDDLFEPTDGLAYARWFAERNAWTGGHRLRKVTRLLKYLRDTRADLSIKSILLTTLIGNQVTAMDEALRDQWHPDVPTSLKRVAGLLDDYLQANVAMPTVTNPVLPSETFMRQWDQARYTAFRTSFHSCRQGIDGAHAEPDQSESIRKWRLVFGDGFAPSIEVLKADTIRDSLVRAVANPVGAPADAVELVERHGSRILAFMPRDRDVPHVTPAPFTGAADQAAQRVQIRAWRDRQRVTSGEIVPPNARLTFEAVTAVGLPFPHPEYQVRWRVANTDEAARRAGELRGGFYDSNPPGHRTEPTKHRGVHWVEAFALRNRDNRCVGASERFYVVIR